MRNPSIRRRIAVWFALSILGLVGVFFALLYTILNPLTVTVAQRRVTLDASSVSEQITVKDGQLQMSEVLISPSTLYTVYNASGQPAYANHHTQWLNDSPFNEGTVYHVTAGGQEWILDDSAVLNADGSVLAYVRAGAPLGAFADTTQALFTVLLISVPVVGVLALFVGLRLARRSLRPIAEITQTAQEISAGDYARRLTLHGTDDEVGQLETTLNSMLDSLERSIEREKQFTSNASHELRTPLAVILGASQTTLDNEDATAADYAAAMRIIYKKATEMQALLSQMLLLARGDSQRKLMEVRPLDLSEIVTDIADEFAAAAAERHIRLETDVEPGVTVAGDLMLVTRAIMNLVDNGIKYGRRGGWLRVSLAVKDNAAVLTVADNGEGIHADDLPHIFGRFYRADNSRSSAGFGLGLALVERIAALHQGNVSVESTVGEGTTFQLILPLVQATDAP